MYTLQSLPGISKGTELVKVGTDRYRVNSPTPNGLAILPANVVENNPEWFGNEAPYVAPVAAEPVSASPKNKRGRPSKK